MSLLALEVRNLSKSYETYRKEAGLSGSLKSFFHREKFTVQAVQDVSFSIKRGEFVGLLGPNGAGKTTTLKMLAGLIKPSGGKATAFEAFETSDRKPAYLKRIGMVMGQRNQLNPDLPALDSFRLAQSIYDIPMDRFKTRLDSCMDLFSVGDKLQVPVRKLSLGERMKMELVLSLIHEPDLVFLDEPTIGLDFNAARQIRDFLRSAARSLGITFILTSHYTKDVEALCQRVILINKGRLLFDGPLKDIDERLSGQKRIFITTSSAAASRLRGIGHGWTPSQSELGGNESGIVSEKSAGPHEVSAVLASLFHDVSPEEVTDIRIQEMELEEVFAEIFAGKVGRAK